MTDTTIDLARYRTDYWELAGGDAAHRFEYDLTADSIVIDAGGYRGDWAAGIRARYGCCIYVFEPIPEFYERIVSRFSGDPLVKVFPFGVAGEDKMVAMTLANEFTSGLRSVGGAGLKVPLRRFADVCTEEGITRIDLLKVNIEGGEYELIEHLVAVDLISRIRDLQVQFHDFVPDAEKRKQSLRAALVQTHYPTYLFDFVWENWRLRPQDDAFHPMLDVIRQVTRHEQQAVDLLGKVQHQQEVSEKLEQRQRVLEAECRRLTREVADLRRSWSFRIGACLLKPVAFLLGKGKKQ